MSENKVFGTCFRNDPDRPLIYGEMNLINPPRQRLRGEPKKEGMSWDFIDKSPLLTDGEKKLLFHENAAKFYRFGTLPDLPVIHHMAE